MTDRRPLIAIILFVVVIGAGVWVRTSSADNRASAPSAPVTTTTVAPASGGSWESGLARVTRVENELYRKPDPSRVGEMMDPGCSCATTAQDRLSELARNGRRVSGDNIVVKHSVLQRQLDPRRVQLVVVLEPGGFPVVDRNGRQVEPGPSRQPPPFTYILVKGADDVWRIADRRSVEGQ